MGRRILNDALRTIVNAEKRGFASAKLQPVSAVTASFLQIMKYRGYVKDFHSHDPHRVRKIDVELLGRINDCRAITYRQDIKAQNIEAYTKRTLPTHQGLVVTIVMKFARQHNLIKVYINEKYSQWGYVIISTPNGLMDHEEAIRQNVGGQVLGYFY